MKLSVIYSLPRSGSAWLSMFLSQPGSYCYHDPLADMEFDQLVERMKARPEGHVAAIDTSLYQRSVAVPPEICTWLLIREPGEVQRSLKMRGWVMNLDTERERLRQASYGAMPIRYDGLHDLDYLQGLWELMVGEGFDRERTEYLIEMNVQRDFAAVKRRVG